MSETWECTACHATADIDLSGPRPVFHSKYPAETGPYSDQQTPHECPIKLGLLPPDIEQALNSRRAK